jgi:bifunctional oligoribonuclease and PAP phosphatase NrnA
MNKLDKVIQQIKESLDNSKRPLILSHIRPDGDAIGSLISMGLALQKAGKFPCLVLEDGLPAKYRFLHGSELIVKKPAEVNDLIISVDCSDIRRLGDEFSPLPIGINIDHHITNELFGKVNLVLPEYPATSAILAEYLPLLGFPLDQDISSALLMGILTDTIGFRTSNVSPALLRQSAQLMDFGADLSDIYNRTLTAQSFPASLLWGMALSRLVRENGLVWTVITLEDRKKAGYSGRDDADLTNILSSIEGSDVSVLFNEENGGKVKVSWRSNEPYDVTKIARQFGGGGHPPASGAEIEGTLEEVEKIVLSKTKQYMKDIHSNGVQKNG